eukprot:2237297-Rhodomonas_salina.2
MRTFFYEINLQRETGYGKGASVNKHAATTASHALLMSAEDHRIGLGEEGAQSYELDPYMGSGVSVGPTRKMIPYAMSPYQTPVGGVGAGAREACSPIGRGGGWRAAFRAHVYDQELARPLFGALTLT